MGVRRKGVAAIRTEVHARMNERFQELQADALINVKRMRQLNETDPIDGLNEFLDLAHATQIMIEEMGEILRDLSRPT